VASPKDPTSPNPVPPAGPKEAEEAATAEPGSVAELDREPVDAPLEEEEESESEELSWIEVELVGEDDEPIPGERVAVEHPDGRVARGTTNAEGVFRLQGIPQGSYRICFTELDEEAWEPA
jgi:hypothetical protein